MHSTLTNALTRRWLEGMRARAQARAVQRVAMTCATGLMLTGVLYRRIAVDA